MNNKGTIFDTVMFLASITGVVITLLICFVVFSNIKTAFEGENMTNTTEIQESMSTMSTSFTTFDKLFFPMAVIALIIGLIITTLYIPSHPIFVIINVIGLVFLIFLGIVFNYVYETLYTDAELSAYAVQLPYVYYGMSYLPWFGAVAVLIATIVGYSKGGPMNG